jgi:type I restriction enzyme M protein
MARIGKPSTVSLATNGAARTRKGNGQNGRGDLGFEATLWQAADKLRGNIHAAEYKHVVLGLIFLKYISDAFEEKRHELREQPAEYHVDPEDRDEYLAENVFWVPREARWSFLQGQAKQPTIGRTLDDAMAAIERDNPRLKGILQGVVRGFRACSREGRRSDH